MKTKTTQTPKAKPGKPGRTSSFFQAKKSGDAFFKAQPKVKVGKPQSRFETEADQMAERAVNNDGSSVLLFGQVSPLVQRKEQEENVQAKPMLEKEETVQTKEEEVQLQEEEEESLQMKEEEEEEVQLQEEEEESLQMKEEEEEEVQLQEEEEESLQMKEEEEEVQRQEEEEESLQAKLAPRPLLHRGLDLARHLRLRRGKGQALDATTKQRMERAFQADFSAINIHTDQEAIRMNQALGAQAFTNGSDIFFNEGKFDPASRKGQLLLAHELTHTIQQGAVQERKAEAAVPESEVANATAAVPPASGGLEPVDNTTQDLATTAGEAPGTTMSATATVEEAPVPRAPEEDPNFRALKKKTKQTAASQKTTPAPGALAANAELAAPLAANEQQGTAQKAQVAEMDEQEPALFDAKTFKKLLLEQIQKILPKNEEEADKFPGSGKMDQVKDNAGQQVATEKEKAGGAIKTAATKTPDPATVEARPVADLAPPVPGAAPQPLPAGKTTPPSRNNSEVQQPLVAESQRVDAEMAANEVTEEQLAKSEEPTFLTALDTKKTAKNNTETAPAKFRQEEQAVRQQHRQKASSKGAQAVSGMFGERKELLEQAAGKQQGTAKDNTSAREAISQEIDKIFQKTQLEVEKVLGSSDGNKEGTIDEGVNSRFERAAKYATFRFEAYIRRKMDAYKKERYGAWFDPRGWGKRVKDTFVGMPDEVNQFYEDGRKQYIADMDVALTGIAQYIASELGKVKQRIAQGRKEVKVFVDQLPKDKQKLAQEAVENIEDKFSQLDSAVMNKQDALIDSVAQQYKESLDAVDERIKEMKAANRGLVDKAMDAIQGVIETIKKLKKLITDLLASIQSLIGVIMADPIGFMKALFAGIKAGIDSFMANIKKHLIGGLFKWLTGSLGPLGITVPDNLFSLAGIFSMVMQVLGLTWEFVRRKMVKLLTEPVVKVVETGFTVIKIIREKGIMGLWEAVKQQFTDLKETVIEAIRNMIITQVIQAGIKWLLSLLIPGAGFVKAIMAIKDVIVFFVESAIALIPTLIDAIRAAAAKNFSGIAKAVEQGLSTLVPLVIGLLARLLNISGLVKKVQKIIKNIRKRIDRAVNKIILKAKTWAKKFVKGVKKKAKKIKDKLVQWWKAKKKFKGQDGKQHTLYLKKKGQGAKVMVASDPKTYGEFIAHLKSVAKTSDKPTIEKAERLATAADEISTKPFKTKKDDPQRKKEEEDKQKELQKKLDALAPFTAKLIGLAAGEKLPDSVLDFQSENRGGGTVGKKMTAKTLSKEGKGGSRPTTSKHTLFDTLNLRRGGGSAYYVKGHLLNEQIHGPGKYQNLTPLSVRGNSNHLHHAETTVKKAVNAGSVVRYTVTPNYDGAIAATSASELTALGIDTAKHTDIIKVRKAEQHVPRSLSVKAEILGKGDDGKWTKVEKTLVSERNVLNPVDKNLKKYEVGESQAKQKVHLLKNTAAEIVKNVDGVNEGAIEKIKEIAAGLKKLDFYSELQSAIDADDQLPTSIKTMLKGQVDKLQASPHVRLKDKN